MKRTHLALAVLLVVAVLAFSAGCTRVDLTAEGERMTETVRAEGAKRAEAEITMGPGELTVTGGARALMDGEFQFSDDRLAPEIDYRVDGGVGELDITQGETGSWFPRFWGGGFNNAWDIEFSDRMPLELRVTLGAGDANFEMGGTMLEELRVDTGAGSVDIDVAGSEYLDEFRVTTGAGDLKLDASGGSVLRTFDIDAGAGSVRLDLTGDSWTEDISGRINAGAGDVVISLPEDVAVEVSVDTGIGDVRAEGLLSDGDVWVNEARGDGGPVIEIEIDQGVGAVRLEVE
jgi:hypothetical protein